jgi:hypothetical protein
VAGIDHNGSQIIKPISKTEGECIMRKRHFEKRCAFQAIFLLIILGLAGNIMADGWCYESEIKTYASKEFNSEVITEHRPSGPFETQKECNQHRLAHAGSEELHVWYAYRVVRTPGPCEACDKGSRPKAKNGDLSVTAADKLADDIVSQKMAKWLAGKVNPVGYGNLAKLSAQFTTNSFLKAALSSFGTGMGAYQFARGYVELFQTASDAAVERALQALQLTQAEGQELLTASGVYLSKMPSTIVQPQDKYLAREVLLKGIGSGKTSAISSQDIKTAAILAIASALSSDLGDNDVANSFLEKASEFVPQAGSNVQSSHISGAINTIRSGFHVQTSGTAKSPVSDAPNKYDYLSGNYHCVQGPSCQYAQPGKQTQELSPGITTVTDISPTNISITGDHIILSGYQYFTTLPGSSNNGYYQYSTSGGTTKIESKCEGVLTSNGAICDCITTSSSTGSTVRSSISAMNTTLPPQSNTTRTQVNVRILTNGDIEISSQTGGAHVYSKIR